MKWDLKSLAKQFGGFLALGGLSGTITVGGSALLHEVFNVPEEIAYLTALIAVAMVNFVMMRKVVMRSEAMRWQTQLIGFLFSTAVWRGLEYSCFLLLHKVLNFHYLLVIVFLAGIFTVLKFFYYRLTFFRPAPAAQ